MSSEMKFVGLPVHRGVRLNSCLVCLSGTISQSNKPANLLHPPDDDKHAMFINSFSFRVTSGQRRHLPPYSYVIEQDIQCILTIVIRGARLFGGEIFLVYYRKLQDIFSKGPFSTTNYAKHSDPTDYKDGTGNKRVQVMKTSRWNFL